MTDKEIAFSLSVALRTSGWPVAHAKAGCCCEKPRMVSIAGRIEVHETQTRARPHIRSALAATSVAGLNFLIALDAGTVGSRHLLTFEQLSDSERRQENAVKCIA